VTNKPYKHKHFLFKKYLIGVYDGGRNIFQQEFNKNKKKPRDIMYYKTEDIYIYSKPSYYKGEINSRTM
jgi:hypothetical protein